jgi:hypothetical protein
MRGLRAVVILYHVRIPGYNDTTIRIDFKACRRAMYDRPHSVTLPALARLLARVRADKAGWLVGWLAGKSGVQNNRFSVSSDTKTWSGRPAA